MAIDLISIAVQCVLSPPRPVLLAPCPPYAYPMLAPPPPPALPLPQVAFCIYDASACFHLPSSLALLTQGVLFGAQHLQIGLLLPLAVTGYVWGVLYINSANLLVPMLIHALWNARIFIGSYLGL